MYECRAMRISNLLLCSVLLSSVFAGAQTSAPAAKAGADSSANVGRTQLYESLDRVAYHELTSRRSALAEVKTRSEAEARQREVRKTILSLLGGLPEKTPLHGRSTGFTQADGYRIEKVIFDSQPDFPVTALLYLPDARPGVPQAKLPAIVVAPGHGASGKASDFLFASTFARNGFAVLSYDPIGQGERLQYPDPAHPGQSLATRPTGEHGEAGLQPTLVGDAVARYYGIRAVDYLQSRPEVDPNRIGAFGCSGGGAMTALLGALDPRIKAIGTACYITSFDTLLPSIGPQDAEQSIPGFIASGLDFPDWVELAAPRPYAIIATTEDMFPFAGVQATEAEARRFYGLFHADANLEFLTGPGHHGNLGPILPRIVTFFLKHLQPDNPHAAANPILPPPRQPGASLFALPVGITQDAFQVTPSGQVATSYPTAETVHTLNLKRYQGLGRLKPLTEPQLQQAVREVTRATAKPGDAEPVNTATAPADSDHIRHRFTLATAPGIEIQAEFYRPADGKHKALLILKDSLDAALEPSRGEEIRRFRALADAGTAVLVIAPRPSPPGVEETKSPILGPFYMSELRAELVGRTLLGLRVDDVISAVNFMSHGTTVDPDQIAGQASGHLGLVLLHAAVLDPRLKHVTIDHTLESYDSLLKETMPLDAPQDILPGVVRRYDIPDLVRALGPRLTFNNPLSGTANLSGLDNPGGQASQ